jgi:hypothetical protein
VKLGAGVSAQAYDITRVRRYLWRIEQHIQHCTYCQAIRKPLISRSLL